MNNNFRNRKNKKISFADWLEKLQQESWQLELLISGFAIYGLFNFNIYIDDLFVKISSYSGQTGTLVFFLALGILKTATIISITNLLIHVLTRGLWIGAIGLRYVSGDINYQKLKYNKIFIRHFRKKVGSFDRYIETLEKISSVLFSYTFLLFFISFSLFFYIIIFLCYILLASFLPGSGSTVERYSVGINLEDGLFSYILFFLLFFHLILGLIVAIDFLSLGLLKKIKQRHIARLYFWIFNYISVVTLSFIWRPLLLNFLDEKFTKWLFALAIPYGFAIGFIIPSFELVDSYYFPIIDMENEAAMYQRPMSKHIYNPAFYDDEIQIKGTETSSAVTFTIPSKVISGNLLQVFVRINAQNDLLIQRTDSTIFKLRNRGFINDLFGSVQYDIYDEGLNIIDTSIVNKDPNDFFKIRYSDSIIESNISKIKDITKENTRFKINNTVINNDTISCDFYIHPENKTEGILCFLPLSSIPIGRNYLSVSRNIIHEKDDEELTTYTYTIPFIYAGKN